MRSIYDLLQNFIGVMIVAMAFTPTAHADFTDDAEFKANGAIVATLETKIPDFVTSNMVNSFGFSMYQSGRNFGDQGAEVVSSNPDLDMVKKHMSGFCSPNIEVEKTGFPCTGLTGVPASEAKLLEMGDISSAPLLSPTKYTTGVALASQALIRNITSPFPNPKYRDYVTSGQLASDATKKKDYAKFMAGQAVLGVALYSFNEIYAARTEGKTLGVTGGSDPAATKTLMEIMKNESTRRFEDPAFATFVNGAVALDLSKEMAIMHAYTMWMDYQRYLQMERIEALLAASLSKFVNDSYLSGAVLDKINAGGAGQ